MFRGQPLVLLSAVVVSALPVLLPVQRVSLFALSELALAATARLLTRISTPVPGVLGTVLVSVLCAVFLSAVSAVLFSLVCALLVPGLLPAGLPSAPAVLSGAPSAGLTPALLGALLAFARVGPLRVPSLPAPRALPGRAVCPPALLVLAAARLLSVPGPVRLPVAARQLVVLAFLLASAVALLVLLLAAVLRGALPEGLRGPAGAVPPLVRLDRLPVGVDAALVLHEVVLTAVAALLLVRRPVPSVAGPASHPAWPVVVPVLLVAGVRFLVAPLVSEVVSVHGGSVWVEASISASLPVWNQGFQPDGPVAGIRKGPEKRRGPAHTPVTGARPPGPGNGWARARGD